MIPIQTEIQFRYGFLNIFSELFYGLDEQSKSTLLTYLDSLPDGLPSNTLEESRAIFHIMTDKLFSEIFEPHEYTCESLLEDGYYMDDYIFEIPDRFIEMHELFMKYAYNDNFKRNFLNGRPLKIKNELHSSKLYRVRDPLHFFELDSEGKYHVKWNKIPAEGPLYLPTMHDDKPVGLTRHTQYHSTIVGRVNKYKEAFEFYEANYNDLLLAVNEYVSLKEIEIIAINSELYLQMLSGILQAHIIPVKALTKECENLLLDHQYTVYIKPFDETNILYKGMPFHIFSSYDLSDDSSYVAKPILNDSVPNDTEYLKYLGIGYYTGFDSESTRSLSGSKPYIMNYNIFVSIDIEEILALLPQKIISTISRQQYLLETDNKIIENESSFILPLPYSKGLTERKLVNYYLRGITESEVSEDKVVERTEEKVTTALTQILKPEEGFILAEGELSNINNQLFKQHPEKPYFYFFAQDALGYYYGFKKTYDGSISYFKSLSIEEVAGKIKCQRLLISVYDLAKLILAPHLALKSLYTIQQQAEDRT